MGLLFFVCLVLLALFLIGDESRDQLAFYRSKIAAGEWWRVYTGQWVHFTWSHTWMNIGATAAVIFTLFFTVPFWRLLVAVSVLPLLVGLGLVLISQDVQHYRGYSAAIHGLITLGLVSNIRQEPKLMGIGLLGITLKIAYEHSPFFDVNNMREQIASAVAIDAHFYGYASGLLLAGMYCLVPFAFRFLFRRSS